MGAPMAVFVARACLRAADARSCVDDGRFDVLDRVSRACVRRQTEIDVKLRIDRMSRDGTTENGGTLPQTEQPKASREARTGPVDGIAHGEPNRIQGQLDADVDLGARCMLGGVGERLLDRSYDRQICARADRALQAVGDLGGDRHAGRLRTGENLFDGDRLGWDHTAGLAQQRDGITELLHGIRRGRARQNECFVGVLGKSWDQRELPEANGEKGELMPEAIVDLGGHGHPFALESDRNFGITVFRGQIREFPPPTTECPSVPNHVDDQSRAGHAESDDEAGEYCLREPGRGKIWKPGHNRCDNGGQRHREGGNRACPRGDCQCRNDHGE